MCSWKMDFHGAGCGVLVLDVEAMVRRWKARAKWESREDRLMVVNGNLFDELQ